MRDVTTNPVAMPRSAATSSTVATGTESASTPMAPLYVRTPEAKLVALAALSVTLPEVLRTSTRPTTGNRRTARSSAANNAAVQ